MKIFYLARMTTAFTPETVGTRPLGGSESALFYIAHALARRGHEITIVNNCLPTEAGVHEGVRYVNFTGLKEAAALTHKNPPDVLIAFRDFPALLFNFTGKVKGWWGHDDFSNVWAAPNGWGTAGRFALRRLAGPLIRRRTPYLFVVSEWLADLCVDLLGYPRERIHIQRNGLYLPYFENLDRPRFRNRLVYTSTPQRGLDILLEIFPKIRAQVPDAELHLYCGLDRGVLSPQDQKDMENIFALADQPGVVLAGTRPHKELAQELSQAALWVYPHHAVPRIGFYAETSCIAAMEAMAAGTPVIASRRGALPELIENGNTGILIDGDPHSAAHKDAMVRETVALLRDSNRWQEMSLRARQFALDTLSWDRRADEWEAVLKTLLAKS